MTALSQIKLSDMDPGQKLEIVCKRCNHYRKTTAKDLAVRLEKHDLNDLYIDEIQARLACHKCGQKAARLTPLYDHLMEGFQGGMA